MQNSPIYINKSLSSLLLHFPVLVKKLEQKDPQFLLKLFDWIEQAEDVLSKHRIVGVAELSGLKSKIISPIHHDDFRGSLRKQQLKVASDILFDLQDCLQRALHPYEEKIQQSREIANQLLTIVSESGALTYSSDIPLDTFVRQVWGMLTSHDQLKAGAVQLRSQLSEQDIHLLIADEIDLASFCKKVNHPKQVS